MPADSDECSQNKVSDTTHHLHQARFSSKENSLRTKGEMKTGNVAVAPFLYFFGRLKPTRTSLPSLGQVQEAEENDGTAPAFSSSTWVLATHR